jgi:hypothetical protein
MGKASATSSPSQVSVGRLPYGPANVASPLWLGHGERHPNVLERDAPRRQRVTKRLRASPHLEVAQHHVRAGQVRHDTSSRIAQSATSVLLPPAAGAFDGRDAQRS